MMFVSSRATVSQQLRIEWKTYFTRSRCEFSKVLDYSTGVYVHRGQWGLLYYHLLWIHILFPVAKRIDFITVFVIFCFLRDLSFKKGDVILLRAQIDENWYQGEISGKIGAFPISYVQVRSRALQADSPPMFRPVIVGVFSMGRWMTGDCGSDILLSGTLRSRPPCISTPFLPSSR